MRARVIDVALLLGLVAVAAGIMWTLFNLGGTQRTTPRSATAPAQSAPGAEAPGAPGVLPVPPDEGAPAGVAPPEGGADGEATARGAEGQAGGPLAPELGAAPGAAASDADPPEPPPPLLSVPPGTVELSRVGFSFVTGGPGACGVVLEAWTHVAVSRELLEAYGCGARVAVTLADAAGERSQFQGVIGDTMNPQFSRTVNVYVGEDEPALEYGVTTGTITPLD